MSADATNRLTTGEARTWLQQLEQAAEKEACWSCECLQGFITELELDAAGDAKSLLEMYEVRPEKLHGYLGCEPCPPAQLFAEYRLRTPGKS